MHRFIPMFALVLSSTAFAADNIYRWKDAAGIEHYTNDLNTIPANVSVVPTSGAEISEISTGRREKSQPEARNIPQDVNSRRADADARRAEAETRLAEVQLRREEAGQEEQWRSLFRASKARITSLQSELDRERANIDDVSGVPAASRLNRYSTPCPPGDRCGTPVYAPNAMFARVRQLEQELKLAVQDHDDLERRASFASVPRHWRN